MRKIGILGLLMLLCASPVEAEINRRVPIPAAQLDAEGRITLAQALVGEADWHTPDHIAIAWVLAKRWRFVSDTMSFSDYIRAYASPLKVDTTRTKWIRALSWDTPLDGRMAAYERHWKRVKALVVQWGQGKLADPCPHAVHWGGPMDRPAKRWRPVNCGPTKNIFYEIPPT